MSEEREKTIEQRLAALEEQSRKQAESFRKQEEGIETLLAILENGKALFKIGEWVMSGLKAIIPIAVGIGTVYQWFRGDGK